MDLKQTIELFRRHWTWLVETGSIHKSHWPEWDFHIQRVQNNCFLCEYINNIYGHWSNSTVDLNCTECPIDWGNSSICYQKPSGLFRLWEEAATEQKRKKIAYQISTLPLKKGYVMHTMEYKFTEKYKSGISLKQIENDLCSSEKYRIGYKLLKENFSYNENIPLITVLALAGTQKNINYLVTNGFIKKIEPEIEYHVGQFFKDYETNLHYVLARINFEKAALICFETGNRFSEPIHIKNSNIISQKEFFEISSKEQKQFKQIKGPEWTNKTVD
jgi:hypothetical protein